MPAAAAAVPTVRPSSMSTLVERTVSRTVSTRSDTSLRMPISSTTRAVLADHRLLVDLLHLDGALLEGVGAQRRHGAVDGVAVDADRLVAQGDVLGHLALDHVAVQADLAAADGALADVEALLDDLHDVLARRGRPCPVVDGRARASARGLRDDRGRSATGLGRRPGRGPRPSRSRRRGWAPSCPARAMPIAPPAVATVEPADGEYVAGAPVQPSLRQVSSCSSRSMEPCSSTMAMARSSWASATWAVSSTWPRRTPSA